jgi:outer membrane protein TolC
MMRWLAILLLTATLAEAQTPPQPASQATTTLPKELSLSQALEIALSNNTNIREAQAQFDQVTGQKEKSKSVLLPTLTFDAHQALMTVNLQGIGIDAPGAHGVQGPFGSMDARLNFSMDLLNIANRQSWKSYGSRLDSSRFQIANAREAVTLNVVGAYLQALRIKATRDTLSEQTRLANDLFKLTSDRAAQGVSSQLDANRAKQQVNALEQQRLEAEQSYVAAKLELATLLHVNITDDYEVADTAAYGSGQTMDRDAMIKAALLARPDYLAAESTMKAAELESKSAKSERIPTFKIVASDGQSGNSPVHNNNTYRVAGVLSVPILDSGRISGELHDAEGRYQEATVKRDQLRAQIEADVLNAISGVEWALKQVATSGENVGLSRQELDLTRARYTQGVADNTEVVNAQDRLSRADDASIRAQYTLGLSRANLARASGEAETTYYKTGKKP